MSKVEERMTLQEKLKPCWIVLAQICKRRHRSGQFGETPISLYHVSQEKTRLRRSTSRHVSFVLTNPCWLMISWGFYYIYIYIGDYTILMGIIIGWWFSYWGLYYTNYTTQSIGDCNNPVGESFVFLRENDSFGVRLCKYTVEALSRTCFNYNGYSLWC